MPNRVLITGATGLLGRAAVKSFDRAGWEVIGAGFTRATGSIRKLDLSSTDDISDTLVEVKPDVILHCAANRFPDKCDNDPEGTRALNITASRTLAHQAASRDVLLIYISTDYVFPGIEGQAPYEADATPNPPNLYGQTKLDGETAVLEEYERTGKGGGAVVLRVPVLYGQAEKNSESAVNVLMDSVQKAQGEGGSVVMDHWAIRYPTNTEDVGRVCKDIAEKFLSVSGENKTKLPRVLQFSSEDKFTKYEICELFAEIMGFGLENMTANTQGNDAGAAVQRPYDCHLSTKALKELGISVATQDFKGWWRRECRAVRR